MEQFNSAGNLDSNSGDGIDFIFEACIPKDTDGDNIPNYLDLDSDNDGIPDNVEAQTTAGYIAPGTFTDANNDGVNDVYAGGLTPVETTAGIPDYLNTDTDGDGTDDTTEAGTSANAGADTAVDTDYTDVNFGITDPSTLPNTQNSTTPEVDYRDDTANPNIVPVAVDDTETTPQDTPVTIDVIANDSDIDGDTLTVTSTTQPTAAQGTVTIVGGKPVFTPTAGFVGDATFDYTISDGNGGESTATVTITVEEPVVVAIDTDNDGIPDNIDLDDDNDGVLDSIEKGCTPITTQE